MSTDQKNLIRRVRSNNPARPLQVGEVIAALLELPQYAGLREYIEHDKKVAA